MVRPAGRTCLEVKVLCKPDGIHILRFIRAHLRLYSSAMYPVDFAEDQKKHPSAWRGVCR